MRLQMALSAVFPPECISCAAPVDRDFALCATCWADTPFITGLACDACGTPLPGVNDPDQGDVHRPLCDECLHIARPWAQGRAVMVYGGAGRRMILGLKHRDRAEIARAAGPWLARAAADLVTPDTVIVPIPLHRWRLARRRYNQAALLAHALAAATRAACLPDALVRCTATPSLEGRSRLDRFDLLTGSIAPHPRRGADLAGRHVLLIDDVMTTGATFSAAAQAVLAAHAEKVSVLALARAVLAA